MLLRMVVDMRKTDYGPSKLSLRKDARPQSLDWTLCVLGLAYTQGDFLTVNHDIARRFNP